jgi:DNA-directed RNA polymerase delta subunit
MADIKRTMIVSLLIEKAGEMKHKRPTELGFEELVDVVQAVVKNCYIPDVSDIVRAFEEWQKKYSLVNLEEPEWQLKRFLSEYYS